MLHAAVSKILAPNLKALDGPLCKRQGWRETCREEPEPLMSTGGLAGVILKLSQTCSPLWKDRLFLWDLMLCPGLRRLRITMKDSSSTSLWCTLAPHGHFHTLLPSSFLFCAFFAFFSVSLVKGRTVLGRISAFSCLCST